MINKNLGALVLAGGQGRRMGYRNKGLIPFAQVDLIDPVLQVLQQQCAYVAISANQDIEQYQKKQLDVWPDTSPWLGLGPLAGVCSCEPYFPKHIEYIQVVPCDSPFISPHVIQALCLPLQSTDTLATYAITSTQIYPVIFQFKRVAITHLKQYLTESNQHSIRQWLYSVNALAVHFSDDFEFINMNDMATLERYLPQGDVL